MAKEVASAVTSVVADRAVTKLLDNLNKQTSVTNKLQRLEILLIRIRSTIEVSEKHTIESATLLQWLEKLKEAASHGDEVLRSFQQQEQELSRGNEASCNQNGKDQQASASTSGTSLSFTRKALSSMAKRIHTAATALFTNNTDMKKLDATVEMLEKASADNKEFIGLLQLETSPNFKRRRLIHKTSGLAGFSRCVQTSAEQLHTKMGTSLAYTPPDDQEVLEVPLLVRRLQEALSDIDTAVEMVKDLDVNGLEWLAQWVDLLRDAKQQGCTFLSTITTKAGKETVEYDIEEDELRSFLHTIESLAGDFECLARLTSLCLLKQFSFPC
ncbi:hypothetical protein ACP70R_025729 [Stipagrostis hirtigluma subsp. patula]